MSTKKTQAQRIYNESIRKGWNRQQIIEEFMYQLQMTAAGASTYFYNCQKAAKPNTNTNNKSAEAEQKRQRDIYEEAVRRQRAAEEAAARAQKTKTDYESFTRQYSQFFRDNFRKAAGGSQQEQPKPKVEIKAVHWTVLLGVQTNASKEEITKAYRAKAMENHMNGNDQEKLKSLNIAKDEAMKRFK